VAEGAGRHLGGRDEGPGDEVTAFRLNYRGAFAPHFVLTQTENDENGR
jgi:hypothetical protein